jgi:hypothetical protein
MAHSLADERVTLDPGFGRLQFRTRPTLEVIGPDPEPLGSERFQRLVRTGRGDEPGRSGDDASALASIEEVAVNSAYMADLVGGSRLRPTRTSGA